MTEAGRVEPGWGEEVFATGGVKVTSVPGFYSCFLAIGLNTDST